MYLVAYWRFKLSITTIFYKPELFLGFCIKKKNHGISVFCKIGEEKRYVSGLISRIAWVNVSSKPCKANFFVNFLHKLCQIYVKWEVLKHRQNFPPFFVEQLQNVSKKVTFKKFGLFLLFVKKLPFIKKAGYNVKVHEILISKWCCLYILNHSKVRRILVKSNKIRKKTRPVGPNCKNTA